jgi:hypothetical protein
MTFVPTLNHLVVSAYFIQQPIVSPTKYPLEENTFLKIVKVWETRYVGADSILNCFDFLALQKQMYSKLLTFTDATT